MTREEEIILAGKAREILNNDAWTLLIERWNASLLEKVKEHCQDEKMLKEVGHHIQATQNFISALQEMVDTGKMASIQLDREREMKERK